VKTVTPFHFTRIAVIALLLSFMAACDDATGPEFQLDPESTATIMDQVVTDFFEGNEAATSLEYLGESVFQALGGGPLASAGFHAAPSTELAGGIPNHLLSNPVYRAAAEIPDIYEGVTFVWDEVEEGYIASERTGAPLNGVRFILYAVNPVTGLPTTPLNEIGYLDISDASTWPDIDITVEAVIGDATMIYVAVTGNFGETSAWLDFDGYLSDGTDQLTLDMYAIEALDSYSIEFGLGYGNFEASWSMSYTEMAVTLEVMFTDGTDTLVFSMTLEWQQVDQIWAYVITQGSVTLSGTEIALIEGWIGEDTIQVTITNAVGDPLTPAELAALEDAFAAIDELSDFMEGMLEFAAELAWLGAPVR
jgi:hypothetical protein